MEIFQVPQKPKQTTGGNSRLPRSPSSGDRREQLPVERDALPVVAPAAPAARGAVGPRQQVGAAAVDVVGGAPQGGASGLKAGS
jgi:hypothetical protein